MPTTTNHHQYISLTQAAERFAISQKTLRRRISDGTLPAVRVGPKAIRVRPEDVQALFRPIPAATQGR